MRVLVACEESQEVTKAFRKRGVEAFSCDILPCSGGHPEWHYQMDVLPLLADSEQWDLIIAFPPCTDLAVSGARWFKEKRADGRQQKSIEFFKVFTRLNCKRVAIENPVGIMSTHYQRPDQIIQPWQFGDPFEKTTCLWLKNLPCLYYTNIVEPPPRQTVKSGKTLPVWYSNCGGDRAKARSKTFPGIADAMAEQWSEYIERMNKHV